YKLSGNAPGRVTFTGDDDTIYKANYCLRTADRLYIQMAEYDAPDFDALFDGCYAAPWQDCLRITNRVHVDKVRTYRSALESEHAVQGMVHKAIYQKLGDKYNASSMPESGAECGVRVYIENDKAHILLDTSGEPLHKRGYRTAGVLAPIRETTAAVLLQEMLWKRKFPFHDPFCGSGTIPIEAFLFAHDVAPGLGREFAYEKLKIYDERRALEIKKELASKIRTDVVCRISGSDIDPESVKKAQKNAEHAAVIAGRALQLIGSDAKLERPVFTVADVADTKSPYEDAGVLLCNPPYGERMGDEAEASALYGRMSSIFDNFPGWSVGIITSKKGFQKDIGHYADKLKSIKAGNLDTTLFIYTGK
ncbi:MAG: class I SAM-dependent RNA methyltransferase, partial [Treponema sp.]|nr:class I SAM-dependent RNA methyltransferase [Treponema sp.]